MDQLVILAILWTAFCVLHSVLAGIPVKRRLQARLGKNYKHYRLAYTLFAFATLAAVVLYQVGMERRLLFEPATAVRAAGALVSGTGFLLMMICIRKYFMGLSGLRSLFEERPTPELIISGVHRFVRHPLYLGTFVFLWGLLLIFPYASLLLSNTVITVYTLLGIRLEEQKLIGEFGESYRRYRREVPMLIPRYRTTPKIDMPGRQK